MSMTFTIARRMDDGAWWHGHHDAAFNVHNAGGFAILEAIGIEADYCGSHDAADVHARCVAWRATHPAAPAERPMVRVGVDDDYVAERIPRLEALAQVAAAEGAAVGWS
jgi:hypothetical protein